MMCYLTDTTNCVFKIRIIQDSPNILFKYFLQPFSNYESLITLWYLLKIVVCPACAVQPAMTIWYL